MHRILNVLCTIYAVLATIGTVGFIYILFHGNPFPFPNAWPTYAFASPSEQHWLAGLRVLDHYGYSPIYSLHSSAFKRALTRFNMLLNVPPAEQMEQLGTTAGAIEIHVEDPLSEAMKVTAYYKTLGGPFADAYFHVVVDDALPKGGVVLVRVPEQHWLFGFLLPRLEFKSLQEWSWPQNAPPAM